MKNNMSETDRLGRNMSQEMEKLAAENGQYRNAVAKYEEALQKLGRENEEYRRALQEREIALKNVTSEYESFRIQVKDF